MSTLLEYLTTPKLELDRTGLREGPNSFPVGDYDIEGVQPWADFTHETIIQCFGDILNQPLDEAQLMHPPPPAQHLLRLTNEDSVRFVLERHNHNIVERALEIAQELLRGRGFDFPVSWYPGLYSYI